MLISREEWDRGLEEINVVAGFCITSGLDALDGWVFFSLLRDAHPNTWDF